VRDAVPGVSAGGVEQMSYGMFCFSLGVIIATVATKFVPSDYVLGIGIGFLILALLAGAGGKTVT